jgi:hypothetical protein
MNTDPIGTMMLVELALRAGGVPHEPASQVERPRSGGQISLPITTDGYAIVGLDLIINVNGHINLCEANGSNMAATSFGAADADVARAVHLVASARERIEAVDRGVVLIGYARGTGAVAEIMARAAMISGEIRRLKPCSLVDAGCLLPHGMVVVVDTVENIADHITLRDGRVMYRGVEAVSIANPNVLPELVRRGKVERDGAHYGIDTTVFHDGPLVELIHDKDAQQQIANGTGIVPLACFECHDLEACVVAIAGFQVLGKASVAKMNGGSGGSGIEFFGPSSRPDEIMDGLSALLSSAKAKYHGLIERSIWPIRIFEFAESTGYCVGSARHLWDMRVMALISPGVVDLSFCGIRLCPEPFTKGLFNKGSVLSNVTGRSPDLLTTRSPLVEFGRPTDHLRFGGVDDRTLERIAKACAQWCQAAWASYAGNSAAVVESSFGR